VADITPIRERTSVHPRYRVGCAGQFVQLANGTGGLTGSTNDVDEAFVLCLDGPAGCEVYDTHEDRWIGPTSIEEIDAAKARLEARNACAP
jgi:hypothetical protein